MASPHAAAVKTGVNAAVQAYEEAVTVPAPTYEEAVTTATRAYEEAVATAAHAYEEAAKGKRSTWMAKLQFEPLKRKAQNAFRRSKGKKKEASKEAQVFEYSEEEKEVLCSQVKAGLIKTILEITLNHRLPRP
ncbi:hypothetical protein BDR04DRAFT_1096777 [Suillus decipiens]|nr:hypothetical protein BDR04DRAFT_1096777 [Suillus decipiens]